MNAQIIRFLFFAAIALAIALLLLFLPMPVPASSEALIEFHIEVGVNTTTDEYNSGPDCSLREAIKTMNVGTDFGGCVFDIVPGSGPGRVWVPSGTYTLTLAGSGEDSDATGDLDITVSMMISATGAVTVTGNTGWGDRIFHIVTGAATISGLTIRGGFAGSGGGIYNSGTLVMKDVTLESNSAHENVSNSSGSYDQGTGGGIYNAGSLTLYNATLSSNGSGHAGGGIYNAGTATLDAVTFSGNNAYGQNFQWLPYLEYYEGYGGGIFNAGTVTLTNVTLSSNLAYVRGGGLDSSGAATLTNVTLKGNVAYFWGGGIYRNTGSIALTNTIVADSTGGNCNPSLGGSSNLSSDNTCGFGAGRDNINVMLGPLANNGGATLTHALLPGSPAIDFGTDASCPSTDQRGVLRPIGAHCDVGAYEAGYLFLPLILK